MSEKVFCYLLNLTIDDKNFILLVNNIFFFYKIKLSVLYKKKTTHLFLLIYKSEI